MMQNFKSTGENPHLCAEDKHTILKQLSEMFDCLPDKNLQKLCEEHSWNIERCIDLLISRSGRESNDKLHSGAVPKKNISNSTSMRSTHNKFNDNGFGIKSNSNYRNLNNNSMETISIDGRVAKSIKDGSRVMVILRGAPGSGKSFLAKSLVEKYIKLNDQYSLKDFIFSTDDYFYDSSGRYKWQMDKLSEAHEFNQKRVRERALNGWSPIFVDNTNMQLWEMMPYVQVAVQNGYLIELLEAKSSWRNSSRKLALKNKHGVPADKIQAMLDRYEKGTVADVLKMLKTPKYNIDLPQMRNCPPVFIDQQDNETEEVFQIYRTVSDKNTLHVTNTVEKENHVSTWPTHDSYEPKSQREKLKPKAHLSVIRSEEAKNDEPKLVQQKDEQSWQPHEKEMISFWQLNNLHNDALLLQESVHEEALLSGELNESLSGSGEQSKKMDSENNLKQHQIFNRHSINCPNENEIFASLRQIYPNKEIGGLWDLFIKCNGDIDWVVDLLLVEDEIMSKQDNQFSLSMDKYTDDFQCNCGNIENITTNLSKMPMSPVKPAIIEGVKPQRQRIRSSRFYQRANAGIQEISETIANRFVLSEERYPPHIRKLREKLRGSATKSYANTEVQTDPLVEDPEDDDNEINEILEVTLGDDLVKQLRNVFQIEMATLVDNLPDNIALKVFMPRSIAKELYMLWVESAYNHIEEERQQTLRDDENFARLLKNPKYENISQSPSNLQELLDLELAKEVHLSDQVDQENTTTQQHQPNNLATHLTQMKLCETFPDIPRETLIEFLLAHNNNYEETVKMLCDSAGYSKITEFQNDLLKSNQDLLNVDHEQKEKASEIISSGVKELLVKSLLQPEEAKRLALHDFEDMRNLAAHHCQLKAECYQKAKEAIQKGNSAVAVYYSQIAGLHKMKLDMYNHRAANCIMDVHKYTQNNPELLDLHYLHVLEAISCLDLFLDRHITWLRAASRSYKHVFIITGRGLHSAGGVSTIKNKVKSRLKERNLRWSEVNPGLLKVKIFSASRHSKNI